jgi:hypothetical protein
MLSNILQFFARWLPPASVDGFSDFIRLIQEDGGGTVIVSDDYNGWYDPDDHLEPIPNTIPCLKYTFERKRGRDICYRCWDKFPTIEALLVWVDSSKPQELMVAHNAAAPPGITFQFIPCGQDFLEPPI